MCLSRPICLASQCVFPLWWVVEGIYLLFIYLSSILLASKGGWGCVPGLSKRSPCLSRGGRSVRRVRLLECVCPSDDKERIDMTMTSNEIRLETFSPRPWRGCPYFSSLLALCLDLEIFLPRFRTRLQG